MLDYACFGLKGVFVFGAVVFLALFIAFFFGVSKMQRAQERAGGLLRWLFPLETAPFSRDPSIRSGARRLVLFWMSAAGVWVASAGSLFLAAQVCHP